MRPATTLARGSAPDRAPAPSPFRLDDECGWRAFRERKLAHYPSDIADLVVEVRDPRALTPGERDALLARCSRANMAVYATGDRSADKDLPRLLAAQCGLVHLDRNWLADDDGISRVTVAEGGGRALFIPYTNRPIRWHTDGYYHPAERTIRAMVLHCVARAAEGGENALMDPEIAFLLLHDADPAHVRALSRPDAMTIPERQDEDGVARPAQSGPVFSVDERTGHLHMRYTARTRSIKWHADPDVRAAVAALERLLATPSPFIHRITLEPGMGLLCNNVLHDRSGFTDDPRQPRLIYRARYHDRVAPLTGDGIGGHGTKR
ncbi:MAG: TauD/TfdA family dioxygenase [Burkholderiales bacterium]|nr:TauD/TfdA family dioxygenase [Burkholderiales bacterium]